MTRKVVFLDIDGTIVTRDGRMPDSTVEALRAARENGHETVLCTGRSRTQIFPNFNEEDFCGCIASAGANIYCRGEPLFRAAMDPQHIRTLVDYFRENRMSYFLQAERGLFSEDWAVEETRGALRELNRSEEDIDRILYDTHIVDRPEDTEYVEKCCYFHCTTPADRVQADLGPYYTVIDSSFRISRFCDGEVTISGVNKASGMEKYLAHVGLSREDSIAFGDGPNDIEMVEFAAVGVAMGNAVRPLKDAADRVCGHIEEDGLYNEFKALGLI